MFPACGTRQAPALALRIRQSLIKRLTNIEIITIDNRGRLPLRRLFLLRDPLFGEGNLIAAFLLRRLKLKLAQH